MRFTEAPRFPTLNLFASLHTQSLSAIITLPNPAVQVLTGIPSHHPQSTQDVFPEAREGVRRGPCTLHPTANRSLHHIAHTSSPAHRRARRMTLSTITHAIAIARSLMSSTEGPQDPHHPHLPQGRLPREGLPGADRPCSLQVPAGQGPRPSAHQDPEHLHP